MSHDISKNAKSYFSFALKKNTKMKMVWGFFGSAPNDHVSLGLD